MIKGQFIEPMLLLRTDALPNDREPWEYEPLKVDEHAVTRHLRDYA
jgi:hypothetical protein